MPMGGGKGRYLCRRGGVLGRPPRWGPALYLRMAADVPLSFNLSPAAFMPQADRICDQHHVVFSFLSPASSG